MSVGTLAKHAGVTPARIMTLEADTAQPTLVDFCLDRAGAQLVVRSAACHENAAAIRAFLCGHYDVHP